MTGFGHGTAQRDDVNVIAEVRSLNHRFFDINIKFSTPSYSLEKKIRDLIKSSFHRGKIDVHILINKFTNQNELPVNFENASKYYHALITLCDHLKIKETITLSSITPFFREIIGIQEQDLDPETLWPLIEAGLQKALQALKEMRMNEGKSLYQDIKNRVIHIDSTIKQIHHKFPQLIIEYREQLSSKISEHFPDITVEPGRLEQELVIFAEKIDITEELTRADSHLHQIRELLRCKSPIGRKLEFLLQEIHREVNTMGYKTINADICQMVVEIKSELEKIREQTQNIE